MAGATVETMSDRGQDIDTEPDDPAPTSSAGSVFGPRRRPRLRRIVGAQFPAEMGDGVSLVALPVTPSSS